MSADTDIANPCGIPPPLDSPVSLHILGTAYPIVTAAPIVATQKP
jgi:hypothetical protein